MPDTFKPVLAGVGRERVEKLVENIEWVLQFLTEYPPHFSDGKSMSTDLGEGLAQLEESLAPVKEMIE